MDLVDGITAVEYGDRVTGFTLAVPGPRLCTVIDTSRRAGAAVVVDEPRNREIIH
jgi:hypothetical protein